MEKVGITSISFLKKESRLVCNGKNLKIPYMENGHFPRGKCMENGHFPGQIPTRIFQIDVKDSLAITFYLEFDVNQRKVTSLTLTYSSYVRKSAVLA